MDELLVAFDIDGTILNNEGIPPATPPHLRPKTSVNLEVVLLLQLLSKYTKNVKIIVWSGGGQDYAENIVRQYGLEKYVWRAFGKADYDETIHGKVDICFDDVHACKLAEKNIIVKMK